MITEGNLENFEKQINKEFMLVDFYATWCGPCKMLAPVVKEVVEEEKLEVTVVDIDKNIELAQNYAVMSVPTLMIFKNGNLVNAHTGYMHKEALKSFINENK